VRLANQALPRVGHQDLRLYRALLEEGDQPLAQHRHVGRLARREQQRVRPLARQPLAGGGVDAVDLVQHQQAPALARADLGQHLARDLDLGGEGGVGGVGQVHEEVGVARLVEGRAEARDEVVRQLLDEAHRVGDQDARDALRLERAHGRVERGEERVAHQHAAAGQRAHPRRLPRVRVADQRHRGSLAPAPAARAGVPLDGGELGAQLRDAVADLAAVELQLALAGPAPADAAALAVAAARRLAQARRQVGEARDLDLQARLAAARVALEDGEDHGRAVEHLGAGGALQVAGLRRGEVVVHQHRARARGRRGGLAARRRPGGLALPVFVLVLRPGHGPPAAGPGRPDRHHARPARPARELAELPAPQHRRGREARPPLGHPPHHREAERLGEPRELVERRGELRLRDARERDAHQDGARRLRSRLRQGKAPAGPG
jgi:hypothetical protein